MLRRAGLLAAGAALLAGCSTLPAQDAGEAGVSVYTDADGHTYAVPLVLYPQFETVDEIVGYSDLVVVGSPGEPEMLTAEVHAPAHPQLPDWAPAPGTSVQQDWMHASYEVSTERIVHGQGADSVSVLVPQMPTHYQDPGPDGDGAVVTFPGEPLLEPGAGVDYVFFLVEAGDGTYRLANLDQGVLAVTGGLEPVADADGEQRLEQWREDPGEYWGPTPGFLDGVQELLH